MGLVTTTGNYCYIQCDSRNCNRKIEHVNLKLLKDLARLCGWESYKARWTCPNCTEEGAGTRRPRARQKPLHREIEV